MCHFHVHINLERLVRKASTFYRWGRWGSERLSDKWSHTGQAQSCHSDPELLNLKSQSFSTWSWPPSQVCMDETRCKAMPLKGSEKVGEDARNPCLSQQILKKHWQVLPKVQGLVFKVGRTLWRSQPGSPRISPKVGHAASTAQTRGYTSQHITPASGSRNAGSICPSSLVGIVASCFC